MGLSFSISMAVFHLLSFLLRHLVLFFLPLILGAPFLFPPGPVSGVRQFFSFFRCVLFPLPNGCPRGILILFFFSPLLRTPQLSFSAKCSLKEGVSEHSLLHFSEVRLSFPLFLIQGIILDGASSSYGLRPFFLLPVSSSSFETSVFVFPRNRENCPPFPLVRNPTPTLQIILPYPPLHFLVQFWRGFPSPTFCFPFSPPVLFFSLGKSQVAPYPLFLRIPPSFFPPFNDYEHCGSLPRGGKIGIPFFVFSFCWLFCEFPWMTLLSLPTRRFSFPFFF